MAPRPLEHARPLDPDHVQLLKAYANSLPQPIFEVGPDLRLRFANTAALLAFGYTEEELGEGFFVLDMLEPDERNVGADRVRQMFSGEDLAPHEYVARRKDGSTFPALIFSRAIFENGVLVGLRGIIEDITERKRFEAALLAQQRKERLTLDNVGEIVYAIRLRTDDPRSGVPEFVSARVEAVTGLAPQAFMDDPSLWFQLVHPEDKGPVIASTARVLASREPGVREYRLRNRSGDYVWIEDRIVPQLDGDGRSVGYFGVARDVTERRQALDALEAHSRRQATAARLAQVALDTTDMDALFGEVTAGVAETLGVEFAKVLEHLPESNRFLLRAGVGWRDGLVGVATAPGGENSMAGFTLVADAPVVVADLARESRFTAPDLLHDHGVRSGLAVAIAVGGRPWGVLSAHTRQPHAFTTDEAHFLVAVAGLVASALARRRLEEQLIVSQNMEAVGRLAGAVAHDFNNILTVVLGCADLLLRDVSPEHARAYGTEIRDAAKRAMSLTRQLLSVSRRQVVLPRVIDLRAIVGGLAEMLDRLIGDDVVLTIDATDEAGSVRADPGQIEQVVLNLAINARDAMPEGGRLRIVLDTVDADRVDGLPSGLTGPLVRMTVTDSGEGIDEDTRRHVFEPFFTTKEKGKGTGLGLSTTYGIVEQAGGHIMVASEPGRGSTFTVLLPRVAAPSAETAAAAPAARARATGVTVLLVEDNDAVRHVTARLLSSDDRTVLEATGPNDAVAVAGRHPGPIDLLVTDVIMPEGSGPALAERLRRQRPDLRVLYMSGYTDETLAPRNVGAPGSAFIQKPFDAGQLEEAVRDVLDAGWTPP